MNLKKVKKVSTKIHRLIHEMDSNDDFSTIDQALLKKYLVNLYDLISHLEPSISKKEGSSPPLSEESLSSASTIESNEMVVDLKQVTDPIVEKVVEVIEKDETQSNEPIIKQPKAAIQDNNEPNIIDEILASFSGDDIAQKLSMQPIKDIFKAMSINERIFTINELFDGKNDVFMDCINLLNEASSIDEAKSILITNAVIPFEWDEKSKSKKVTKFVQLMYRKFI